MAGLSKYVKCTFDEAVDEEIAELKQLNITADMPLADFQKKYLQKADELPMNHGGHSIVARGIHPLLSTHHYCSMRIFFFILIL